MFLTSSFILKELYDEIKFLIQTINKEAKLESYVVVTARFKKFKKDVDQIVYLRCNCKKKIDLNKISFKRRFRSDIRFIKCLFSGVIKRNN